MKDLGPLKQHLTLKYEKSRDWKIFFALLSGFHQIRGRITYLIFLLVMELGRPLSSFLALYFTSPISLYTYCSIHVCSPSLLNIQDFHGIEGITIPGRNIFNNHNDFPSLGEYFVMNIYSVKCL